MILTRIKRGAIRTHLLIRNKFENYPRPSSQRLLRMTRSVALSGLALHTVLMPVPLPAAASVSTAFAAGDDTDPLPYLPTVTLNQNSVEPLMVQQKVELNTIQIGKSVATARQEEENRLILEKRNKEQAEKARLAQQQEEARIEARKRLAAQAPISNLEDVSGGSVQQIAYELTASHFGEAEWPAMDRLIRKESNYNTTAYNGGSGAYGIPQALPGSKMASAGSDWRTNPATQLRWMIGYVSARYGSPSRALTHSLLHGWY